MHKTEKKEFNKHFKLELLRFQPIFADTFHRAMTPVEYWLCQQNFKKGWKCSKSYNSEEKK